MHGHDDGWAVDEGEAVETDSSTSVESTPWVPSELDRQELDRRIAAYEADPMGGDRWEDVRARILSA